MFTALRLQGSRDEDGTTRLRSSPFCPVKLSSTLSFCAVSTSPKAAVLHCSNKRAGFCWGWSLVSFIFTSCGWILIDWTPHEVKWPVILQQPSMSLPQPLGHFLYLCVRLPGPARQGTDALERVDSGVAQWKAGSTRVSPGKLLIAYLRTMWTAVLKTIAALIDGTSYLAENSGQTYLICWVMRFEKTKGEG